MENNDSKKIACQIMEINYMQKLKKDNNQNNYDLFPMGWFDIEDYKKKIEILAEAISKNIEIIQTKSYQDIIEKKM